MAIYNISIPDWTMMSVVYVVFICVVAFVGFQCRDLLKAGAEVLLSVLKLKTTDHDGDTPKEKAVILTVWSGVVGIVLLATVLLTVKNVETIIYIHKAKNANSIVSGEIVNLEYQDEYYRGEYLGKSAQMEVDGTKLFITGGNCIDDETVQKLNDAEKVTVLYFKYDGVNEIAEIRIE